MALFPECGEPVLLRHTRLAHNLTTRPDGTGHDNRYPELMGVKVTGELQKVQRLCVVSKADHAVPSGVLAASSKLEVSAATISWLCSDLALNTTASAGDGRPSRLATQKHIASFSNRILRSFKRAATQVTSVRLRQARPVEPIN
jgi:urease accessory protein UreF